MPLTLSRSKKEPFEPVVVEVNRPSGLASPRWVVFVKPEITRYFEEYTPNSEGDHRDWKSFEHYKCQLGQQVPMTDALFSVDLVSNTDLWTGTIREPLLLHDTTFGSAGSPIAGLPVHYAKRQDGGFVPEPADLDGLVKRSLQTMLPNIRSELSLVNSVIELKDFRGSFRKATVQMGNFRNAFRGHFRRFSLKQLARSTPGGYLQYMFNLRPLVSDILAIYRAVKRTERRINDLVTREGRVRTQHFACHLTESDRLKVDDHERNLGYLHQYYPSTGSYDGAFLAYVDVASTREVITDPTMFHAQIQYNYNYTGYQREHARVLALLDSLGVNLNPAIIWNAIPWSFVVDWVAGVGRYLDSYKVGHMDPQINILRYLWSVKRRRTVSIRSRVTSWKYYQGYGSSETYVPSSIILPAFTESSYRRSVILPDRNSFETSGLSSTEFSLGAALVLARRRRSR